MARNFFRLDRFSPRSAAVLQIVLTAVPVAALTSLVWWSSGWRPDPAPAPPPAPKVERPEPAAEMGRAGLIDLADAAASAYSAGLPPPNQSTMVGRPFVLRINFACARPDLSVAKEPGQRTIKLTARLQDWTGHPAVKGLPGSPFDRVEGLWLPRPWIASDGCRTVPPPVVAAARAIDQVMIDTVQVKPGEPPAVEPAEPRAEPEPPPPTLGLASFFGPGSDRARQRGGKPYETVQKLDATLDALAPKDFTMVIEGRIGQAAPGRPVTCHATSIDQRPVCLVAIEIERVAFNRTGSDQPLAEWRP